MSYETGRSSIAGRAIRLTTSWWLWRRSRITSWVTTGPLPFELMSAARRFPGVHPGDSFDIWVG